MLKENISGWLVARERMAARRGIELQRCVIDRFAIVVRAAVRVVPARHCLAVDMWLFGARRRDGYAYKKSRASNKRKFNGATAPVEWSRHCTLLCLSPGWAESYHANQHNDLDPNIECTDIFIECTDIFMARRRRR